LSFVQRDQSRHSSAITPDIETCHGH
jgi:hypothetical protein